MCGAELVVQRTRRHRRSGSTVTPQWEGSKTGAKNFCTTRQSAFLLASQAYSPTKEALDVRAKCRCIHSESQRGPGCLPRGQEASASGFRRLVEGGFHCWVPFL